MSRGILLAFSLLLSACAQAPAREPSITVISEGDARVVDTLGGAVSAAAQLTNSAVAQGLVSINANGEVVPALAESWIVTDDGLSYIFRLQNISWSDGRKVSAAVVAARLRALLGSASRLTIKAQFNSIAEIVAMTDRVLEIRLRLPQPNLLPLLAHPDLMITQAGRGTGPYFVHEAKPNALLLRLRLPADVRQEMSAIELEKTSKIIRTGNGLQAIARFKAGRTAMVAHGTIDTLPYAEAGRVPRETLRLDPVAGLFGLVANASSSPLKSRDIRRALAMAIDRQTLVSHFPGIQWLPRELVFSAAMTGQETQPAPDWVALSLDERRKRARLILKQAGASASRLSIAMPDGPGGKIIFAQLKADFSLIGITLARPAKGERADLRLLDLVAPVNAAGWYFTSLSCAAGIHCNSAADAKLIEARSVNEAADRAKLLDEIDKALAEDQIFIPIAAPVRWSLVQPGLIGFRENSTGFHPILPLRWANE